MSMKCDRCGEVFNPEPPDEMGRHKPNAVILVDKNVEECEENLLEELADIKVAFTVYLSDSKPCIKARVLEEINKTAEIKLDRWLSRLEAKEQSDE